MKKIDTNGYADMELLRFTAVGSVDDGKSTLIGRLLYDSKSIFEDQLKAIIHASEQKGEDYINLALLTDGLRAEREQGITIDVAYRYFATPKRKFIIADTPGHIQYTRNMVTGASTSNLALILIDARKGLLEQSRRHTYIAAMLGIPQLIVCINKMDLVDYAQDVFEKIKKDFEEFSAPLGFKEIYFVPISALLGDNVVNVSQNMPWYNEGTLLHLLETLPLASLENLNDSRMPVQYVIRTNNKDFPDFRGYAGQLAGGVFKKGDEIIVLPSGFKSRIKALYIYEKEIDEAFAPMSVVMTLEDEIDISRGDMIADAHNQPDMSQNLQVTVCWFNKRKATQGNRYILRQTSRETPCIIENIIHKIDINTMNPIEGIHELDMNDIGLVNIKTAQPIVYDRYKKNRITGSLILIDESTNETVGAGMIL